MSSILISGEKYIPIDDKLINYGILNENFKLSKNSNIPFYITTAIAYTNGYPHVGHAYEFISADIIARYMRLLGYDVFFCTGTDEHGQKVAAAAEKSGLLPIDHCNIYVNAFKALMQRLVISNNYFIRTTDKNHEETSRELWSRCDKLNNDIYLSSYEGWYNEREETFVTEQEAQLNNYVDIGTNIPLKRVSEESYFFKMSKYTEQLINKIENEPNFIQPEMHKNSILTRLKTEGLKDLSISRTTFTWGITVSKEYKQNHVMYVWFDALTNYLSAVHGLDNTHILYKYWPANVHIIGKDIIWFHCVIWPCMLMSANVPLPKCVYSHGFVNASDGRKMSKTFNNSIDPNDILDKYPIDSIRYYLTASVTYGADVNFSINNLITMHNSELADILGNLVHRVLNLCDKYCNSIVPNVLHDEEFNKPFDIELLIVSTEDAMKSYSLHHCSYIAMEAVRSTNKWLTEAEPWKMKGENESRRISIVRTALEALYIFTHFLAPIMPQTAKIIFHEKLNTEPKPIDLLNLNFYNLIPGTKIVIGEILFTKIDDITLLNNNNNNNNNNNKDKNKEKNKIKPIEVELDMNQPIMSRIDIRVGLITKIWNHPTAERLYCEEIDVGEGVPRQIASGLRENYKIEELQNRKVLVVCNLKESKFQGFLSNGMVLATKRTIENIDGTTKIVAELIDPDIDALIGERILPRGIDNVAWNSNDIKKNKIWEQISLKLHTNEIGHLYYDNEELFTNKTYLKCSVPNNFNSPVS